MGADFTLEDGNVERRIEGEFMTRLQESEVPFEIIEVMEGLIDEPDLGGEDEIVERIQAEVFDDGD